MAWRWLLCCGLLVACAAPAPVPPERLAAEEQRLLAPFVRGGEVGCGELVVEMTGNFYDEVGQPSVDPVLHSATKEVGPGYVDTIWTNKTGSLAGKFVIAIGEPDRVTDEGWARGRVTRFTVLHQVRFRVFEGQRALTLNVRATGQPLVVLDASSNQARDCTRYAVVDGVLDQR